MAMTFFSRLKMMTSRHPIVRGMMSYGVLWPVSNALEDLISGCKPRDIDWKRCLRFSAYGSLVEAPALYGWVRLSSVMWPGTNFKAGITKGIVEQFSYGPFSLSCFFIGMNLLEFKGVRDGVDELSKKFVPTMKVALCFWPFVQTLNFSVIPERNRVIFVSVVSFMWTIFLTYMKKLDKNKMDDVITQEDLKESALFGK